jgi:hypothetical protein
MVRFASGYNAQGAAFLDAMVFTSPLILLALLPWAGLALWLLRGRPPRHPVPFLPLWQGPLAQKPTDRSFRAPPLWVTAALLAALLSILAAAAPVVRSHSPSAHLTVLLDRGATMSALGDDHRPRYVEIADVLDRELRQRRGARFEIELVDVLTGERRQSDLARWLTEVTSYRRTAVDTSALITPAIIAELARSPEGVIIVLTDHPASAMTDPRLWHLTPQAPWRNIGITSIAARERPSPEVMIALRNDSDLTSARLDVRTANQTVSRSIPLPPRGQASRQFIDVPRLGDTVEVKLDAPDGCDADNQAYLVRDASPPPRLEVRAPLPEPIRRIASLYARANPSPAEAEPIALVNRPADLLPGDSGAIIESPAAASPLSGDPQVITHPVTAVVDWPKVTRSVVISAAPTAREWTPLATLAGHTLVAVRESPARQVWVGFDSPQFPREPDFVIFWTNVFNWLRGSGSAGGNRDHFIARPVMPLPASWSRHEPPPADVQPNAWPGIYAHPDGRHIAANALDLRPGTTEPTSLAVLPKQLVGGMPLSPWLLVTALACLLVSAATWRRPVRAAGFSPALRASTSLID